MDFLIEVATAIVAKLAEYTVASARRLCHYTSSVNNLRDRIQEFNDARQNIQGRVNEAVRDGEEIYEEVQSWLSDAGGISQRVEDFLNNARDRANISCCNLHIPNLASRHQLSREARQMVEDLTHQILTAKFNNISFRPALHGSIATRGDYEHFESRKMILEEIMKALQDPEVSKIGVYGMGGIGKTMLAKEVARRATEAKLFTEVAMTTLSQTPDSSRLQQEIAEKIHLNISGIESVAARADRLQRRLMGEKSILIILDDIWERLDLLEVGIHFEHQGCKILMTSRSLDVVHSMGAEKNFRVDSISLEEATNLFRTIVGDIFVRPDIKSLATDVVGECAGLPLAITTVASALKSQDSLAVWRDTLRQLRSIPFPTNIDEPLRKVYRSIRLSYDFLSDEERSLLLLCSLHGEDWNIEVENLMKISVGWDLFQNVHTLADARTRVESLVVRLQARCLLDDSFFGTVKMHDIIRDVALSIASEERDMNSIVINKLKDCMNKKKLKDSKVMSLLPCQSSDIQLPEKLECPQLELLFSHNFGFDGRHIPIPNQFLQESKDQLKSLLFERASLVPLPPSLHSLQNLQTLCLRHCVLEDVSFIGDLKNLIILDLSYSTIKQLPINLRQLRRLQLLNLQDCFNLELIEPNVISSLTRLEELCVAERYDKWEVGQVIESKSSNANLSELMNLQKLTSLSLRIPDATTFPKDFMFSEKLERYKISICDSNSFHWYAEQFRISRLLLLKHLERSQLKALGLESLMKSSEMLSLIGLRGVKDMAYDLDNEGFSHLKHLDFVNSDGVQYVIDCNVYQRIHPCKAFPMLERLCLWKLTNLESICQGKLPEDSFNRLREVNVGNCDKLKNLFPLSIAKRLHSLQIIDCKMMKEIVLHEGEDDAHGVGDETMQHGVEFPSLNSLSLRSLPKFVQFIRWSEAEATCGSSSALQSPPLFSEKLGFPSLMDLNLYGINVQRLWPDCQLGTTSYMHNLTNLDIRACNKLKYLFSLSVAERLVNLSSLQVRDCEAMQDIVVTKNLGEEGRSGKILFPELCSLKLSNLPALQNFCVGDCVTFKSLFVLIIKHCPQLKTFVTGNCIEFESLSRLTIKNCPELKTFVTCFMPTQVSVDNKELNHLATTQPLFNEKVILPDLKYLETDWSNSINEIVDMSQSSITVPSSFSNHLKGLKVKCRTQDKPIGLSIFKLLQRYQNLETLELNGFFMDEILEDQHLRYAPSAQECDEQVIARLKMLKLDNVPKLRNIMFGEPENAQPRPPFVSFQNVTILVVSFCHRLTCLLTPSTVASLVQLKEMRITNCNRMVEIIGDYKKGEITEGEHDDHELVFTQLAILVLHYLPNLGSFYSGIIHIRFPKLKTLVVSRCPEMRTFSYGIISTSILDTIEAEIEDEWRPQSTDSDTDDDYGEHNTFIEDEWRSQSTFSDCDDSSEEYIDEEHRIFVEPVQEHWDGDVNTTVRKLWEDDSNLAMQHLFVETIILPDLEYLSTSQNKDINEILDMSQPSSDVPHCNLKVLGMNCKTEDKPIGLSISKLLHRYQNLEIVTLFGFFKDGICEDQQLGGAQECEGQWITSLRELSLSNIPKLRHLLGEPEIFLVSFQNLTILEVSECHRLTYLLALSTATSLVQLKEMSITSCNGMTKIISDYKEDDYHELVFTRLEILELHQLPNLESFYSGNVVIRFPKLETLVVSRCPEMRTFSSGIISTSMLDKITTELEDELRSQSIYGDNDDIDEDYRMSDEPVYRELCNDDVNTTVRLLWEDTSNLALQQLFMEMEVHDFGQSTSSQAARL